jgi:hypothetical protein
MKIIFRNADVYRNGKMTKEGAKAYEKLDWLLHNLDLIVEGIDYPRVIRQLDEIVNEKP